MEKYSYHVRANAMLLQFAYFYTQDLALAPQVLAEQLTLSQPGEQITPTTELRAPFPPPGFSDLATALSNCIF